jgi:antitoxin FitA
MGVLTIRNFDDDLKERLRVRAAEHGRSMESEVREILAASLKVPTQSQTSGREFLDRLKAQFAGMPEGELELPPREPAREPPDFS